jgi:hypothetical protein
VAPEISASVVPYQQKTTIINTTTVVENYSITNNFVVNRAIDPSEVEAVASPFLISRAPDFRGADDTGGHRKGDAYAPGRQHRGKAGRWKGGRDGHPEPLAAKFRCSFSRALN